MDNFHRLFHFQRQSDKLLLFEKMLITKIGHQREDIILLERFFVTQQAVSNNLKLMENEVGAKLLKRTSF